MVDVLPDVGMFVIIAGVHPQGGCSLILEFICNMYALMNEYHVILFAGTHADCVSYMLTCDAWVELIDMNENRN